MHTIKLIALGVMLIAYNIIYTQNLVHINLVRAIKISSNHSPCPKAVLLSKYLGFHMKVARSTI